MSISGNLATMGLEEILQWISQGQKSGTLVLMDGETERRLVFDWGSLIGVEPRIEYSTTETHSDALRSIQATAEQLIGELLRWPSGDFRFLDGQRPADLPPGLSIEATRLLLLSAGRVDAGMAARRKKHPGDFQARPHQATGARVSTSQASGAEPPFGVSGDGVKKTRQWVRPAAVSQTPAAPRQLDRERLPISTIDPSAVPKPSWETEQTTPRPRAVDPLTLESLDMPNLDVLDALAPGPVEGSRSFSVRQPPKRSFAVLALGLTALAAAIVALASGHRQESIRPATAAGMATREAEPRLPAEPVSRPADKIQAIASLASSAEWPETGSPETGSPESEWAEAQTSNIATPLTAGRDGVGSNGKSSDLSEPRTLPTNISEPVQREPTAIASVRREAPDFGRSASGDFGAPADAVGAVQAEDYGAEDYGPEEAGYRIAPAGQGYEISPAAFDPRGSLVQTAAASAAMPPALSDLTEGIRDRASEPDLPQGSARQTMPTPRETVLLEPGPGVTSPVLLENTVPAYPPQAPPTTEKTLIDVQVLVSADGRPESVLLASEPVGSGFDDAAMNSARLTRWEPARASSGDIGKMWVTVRYRFAARPGTVYDGP